MADEIELKAILTRNLAEVHERIAAACLRVNRSPDEVQLVAVTKYAPMDAVRMIVQLGQVHLGENRPQQLLERQAEIPDARWHLIGQLQRNKVRAVLPNVEMIHSVDSLRLLKRIDDLAGQLQLLPRILLEVNVSGEESKSGFTPEELRSQLRELESLQHIAVQGLMTMAPYSDDPEDSRPHFRSLRELRDEFSRQLPTLNWQYLSMGMSGDFAVAIEEGATLVRIGSTLFEGIAPA